MGLQALHSWASGNWQGYDCRQGEIAGRACRIVLPKDGLREDRRWAWRTEFFAAFANVDLELLRRGHVLAYMNVQNLYGAPPAMRYFAAFYAFTRELQLHPRSAMIGLSRGGLFAYNWAIEQPDKVACIYADAPVCDIRSWPCRLDRPDTYPEDRKRCLEAYGITEEDLPEFPSPVTRAVVLARERIPVIHVIGEEDEVVPAMENTLPLLRNFILAGGNCRYISKPGCGHHPHGLQDPAEIADFIDRAFDRWNGPGYPV